MLYSCNNPRIWEAAVGGLLAGGQPGPRREFKASLDPAVRLCLKNKADQLKQSATTTTLATATRQTNKRRSKE